jgi:hypothetical protein
MRLHRVALAAAAVTLGAGLASAQDRAGRFDQRDGNGDGLLSEQEYVATGGHPGNFRSLDLNGDGVLTRDEFVGREGVAAPDRQYQGRAVKDRGRYRDNGTLNDPNVLYKNESRKVGSASSAPLDNFRAKDANRDGRLSRQEYGEQRTFDRVDRNRDGWISYDEFRASQGAFQPQGGSVQRKRR